MIPASPPCRDCVERGRIEGVEIGGEGIWPGSSNGGVPGGRTGEVVGRIPLIPIKAAVLWEGIAALAPMPGRGRLSL